MEIRSWLDLAYKDAIKILTKNKKTVARLADELLKRETLTGDEIREIVFGKKDTKKSDATEKSETRAPKKTKNKINQNKKRKKNLKKKKK